VRARFVGEIEDSDVMLRWELDGWGKGEMRGGGGCAYDLLFALARAVFLEWPVVVVGGCGGW
jgi:hypothetical protein